MINRMIQHDSQIKTQTSSDVIIITATQFNAVIFTGGNPKSSHLLCTCVCACYLPNMDLERLLNLKCIIIIYF